MSQQTALGDVSKPMLDRTLLRAAEASLRQGDWQGALGPLNRILALRPDDLHARFLRGVALLELRQLAEAERELRAVQARAPREPSVLFSLAQALQAGKQLETARAVYEEFLALVPGAPPALNELATVLADLGAFDAATLRYDELLARDPGSVPALVNRALLLFDGNVAPASRAALLENLVEAARRAPGFWMLHGHAAMALRLLGRDPAEAYARAAALDPAATAAVRESHDYLLAQADRPVFFGERLRVLQCGLDHALLPGLVAEFGVYRATSLNFIAARCPQTVDGFDGFQGLPEIWTETDGVGKYTTNGQLPAVAPNVRLHVGLFADTLPRYCGSAPPAVRLLHVDCDLYRSTRTVLDALGTRLRPGSILVFDEYLGYAGWRDHEYRAFQELVQARGLRYRYIAVNPFGKQVAIEIL